MGIINCPFLCVLTLNILNCLGSQDGFIAVRFLHSLTHKDNFPIVYAQKKGFISPASIIQERIMKTDVDDFKTSLDRLTEIGIALSTELDIDILLEKIVHHARELTHADAGTLYLFHDDELHFEIMQNSSMGLFEGGKGRHIDLPPVALDKSNVSAYAAITRKTVNIDDVYKSDKFDFTGPRKYDAKTGYRSKSMFVVPMEDHAGLLIGVLQMLNAIDPRTGKVTGFPEEVLDLTRALASQAAVAISNVNLIQETKDLFESLIKVLAVAVDAKSPYTGNHVQRVAQFTSFLAQAINASQDGPFKDKSFSKEEMEEIRIAGWLHDVGKVTSPVWVMDKATKLESLFDRIELIRLRFEVIKGAAETEALRKKIEILKNNGSVEKLKEIDTELAQKIETLNQEFRFLAQCNQPGEFMADEKIERLKKIAQKIYSIGDNEYPYIEKDEEYSLSIRKGSLTDKQIEIMRDHASWTNNMLKEIPFKRGLSKVPVYAGQHHEKLKGQGYPEGVNGDDFPLQSRIIAVADFYEALSAKDRPYRKAMSTEKIISVMKSAAEAEEIDSNIVNLMLREKVHERFEKAYEETKAANKKPSGGNLHENP